MSLGPFVHDEVLNEPSSVLRQFNSSSWEVKFSKLGIEHLKEDCEWTNQSLVPASVRKSTLEVTVAESVQPNKGE